MKKEKKYLDLNDQNFILINEGITKSLVEQTGLNREKLQERNKMLPKLKELQQRVYEIQNEIRNLRHDINSNKREIRSSKRFSNRVEKRYSSGSETFIDIGKKSIKHKSPKKLGNYVLLTPDSFKIAEDSLRNIIDTKIEDNRIKIEIKKDLKEKLDKLKKLIYELEGKIKEIESIINKNMKDTKSILKFEEAIAQVYTDCIPCLVDVENQKIKKR